MAPALRRAERVALRPLVFLDSAFNRLYSWRANPLYQSGTIAISLLIVLIVTGLWLILFYRVGAPYESVERITADPWVGRWVRGVHRYASDALLVATAVHAFRMFAQGRSWGPRALAWMSGVVLLVLLYVCGLTGYVMVWDVFGLHIAREGARLIDSLPFLSEPIGRAFAGEQDMMGPFFFLNLFAHIAIPLGMALVLWLHVSRVARPVLLPPKSVNIALVVALLAIAFAIPVGLQDKADVFTSPVSIRMDVLYGWWAIALGEIPGGIGLAALALIVLLVFFVPLMVRRKRHVEAPPSVVDENSCVGCTQCSLDCPYDAITMVTRAPGGRSELVARVDPDMCVSCGICAGSCAPMSIGPPKRTGRDQLVRVRSFIELEQIATHRHVVICCGRIGSHMFDALEAEGAAVYPVDCAGSVHTSVIELLVRAGAGGVLMLTCPPRDCSNREGPRWLVERMYNDREAELQARVDRQRVRVAHATSDEVPGAVAALRAFMAETPRFVVADEVLEDPDTQCVVTTAGSVDQ